MLAKSSQHGMRLPTASLSIGHDTDIVSDGDERDD